MCLKNDTFVFIVCCFLRVGINLPTIEVRFERLTVGAEAYIGSRSLPTFFNFIINILEVKSNQHLLLKITWFLQAEKALI